MAKQRNVKDSFWTDPYIEKLTPDEKLVFLYLLTNPQANIAGVYEIRAKRLAYETGYDIEVAENILKRLEKDKKIIRFNDWVVIINHLKHQYLGSKTAEGVNRIIESTPEQIKTLFNKEIFSTEDSQSYEVYVLKQIPHTYPIHGVSKLPYSNIELSKVKLDKIKLGEFQNVLVSEEELGKLYERFGEEKIKECIEELSGYMASKGKRYSNHYATLLNWAKRKNDTLNRKSKSVTII